MSITKSLTINDRIHITSVKIIHAKASIQILLAEYVSSQLRKALNFRRPLSIILHPYPWIKKYQVYMCRTINKLQKTDAKPNNQCRQKKLSQSSGNFSFKHFQLILLHLLKYVALSLIRRVAKLFFYIQYIYILILYPCKQGILIFINAGLPVLTQ